MDQMGVGECPHQIDVQYQQNDDALQDYDAALNDLIHAVNQGSSVVENCSTTNYYEPNTACSSEYSDHMVSRGLVDGGYNTVDHESTKRPREYDSSPPRKPGVSWADNLISQATSAAYAAGGFLGFSYSEPQQNQQAEVETMHSSTREVEPSEMPYQASSHFYLGGGAPSHVGVGGNAGMSSMAYPPPSLGGGAPSHVGGRGNAGMSSYHYPPPSHGMGGSPAPLTGAPPKSHCSSITSTRSNDCVLNSRGAGYVNDPKKTPSSVCLYGPSRTVSMGGPSTKGPSTKGPSMGGPSTVKKTPKQAPTGISARLIKNYLSLVENYANINGHDDAALGQLICDACDYFPGYNKDPSSFRELYKDLSGYYQYEYHD